MGAHRAPKNTLSFKQFLSPSDFRLGACPFPQAAQLLQIGIVFLVLALSPLGFLGLKHVKLPLLERTSCCKEILCENSNFSAAFCSRKILIMLLYIHLCKQAFAPHVSTCTYSAKITTKDCAKQKRSARPSLYGVGRNMTDRYGQVQRTGTEYHRGI